MSNEILFPFDLNNDNREAYAQTIQLAEREQQNILLFTAIPESHYEKLIDEVYFHLLGLDGYFQTNYNQWKGIPIKQVITEKVPKYIISHPTSLLLNRKKIEQTIGPDKNIITF